MVGSVRAAIKSSHQRMFCFDMVPNIVHDRADCKGLVRGQEPRHSRRVMSFSREIQQIEDDLVALGLKRHNIATAICSRAGLDRTTWQRWRLGETEPTLAHWRLVTQHLPGLRRMLQARKKRNSMEEPDEPVHPVVKRRRRKTRKARK